MSNVVIGARSTRDTSVSPARCAAFSSSFSWAKSSPGGTNRYPSSRTKSHAISSYLNDALNFVDSRAMALGCQPCAFFAMKTLEVIKAIIEGAD